MECRTAGVGGEAFVDLILSEVTGERKVRIRDDLDAAMKEPKRMSPTRYLWIHESRVGECAVNRSTRRLRR